MQRKSQNATIRVLGIVNNMKRKPKLGRPSKGRLVQLRYRESERLRYATDPEYRERKKESSRRFRKKNPNYAKERYHSDPDFRKRVILWACIGKKKRRKALKKKGLNLDGTPRLKKSERRKIMKSNAVKANAALTSEQRSLHARNFWGSLTYEEKMKQMKPDFVAGRKRHAAIRKVREIFGKNYKSVLS